MRSSVIEVKIDLHYWRFRKCAFACYRLLSYFTKIVITHTHLDTGEKHWTIRWHTRLHVGIVSNIHKMWDSSTHRRRCGNLNHVKLERTHSVSAVILHNSHVVYFKNISVRIVGRDHGHFPLPPCQSVPCDMTCDCIWASMYPSWKAGEKTTRIQDAARFSRKQLLRQLGLAKLLHRFTKKTKKRTRKRDKRPLTQIRRLSAKVERRRVAEFQIIEPHTPE